VFGWLAGYGGYIQFWVTHISRREREWQAQKNDDKEISHFENLKIARDEWRKVESGWGWCEAKQHFHTQSSVICHKKVQKNEKHREA